MLENKTHFIYLLFLHKYNIKKLKEEIVTNS